MNMKKKNIVPFLNMSIGTKIILLENKTGGKKISWQCLRKIYILNNYLDVSHKSYDDKLL
jgi:hypothetical protein